MATAHAEPIRWNRHRIATDQSAQGLVVCILMSMVLMAVPNKNFGYVVPIAYLAFQFIWGNHSLLLRTVMLMGVAASVSVASLFFDSMSGSQTNPPGVAMAMLTFLTIFVALSERCNRSVDEKTIHRIVALCNWYVIFQSILGVIQFVLCGNPDAVCGTFGLFDFRLEGITIAQVYLTFNLFSMILFIAACPKTILSYVAISVGTLTCIMAQSGHQTLILAAILGFFGLIKFTQPLRAVVALVSIALLFGLVMLFYPATFKNAEGWYEKTVLNPKSPKWIASMGGAEILAEPKNFLIGTGLGQYSSRAALISSNTYTRTKLPGMLTGQSDYYRETIVPATRVFDESGEGSAISKPYFSMLGLAVELGFVGTMAMIAISTFWFVDNWKLERRTHGWHKHLALAMNIGLLFFLLCCLIENYAEFPQAIFMPFLLFLAAKTFLKQSGKEVEAQGNV